MIDRFFFIWHIVLFTLPFNQNREYAELFKSVKPDRGHNNIGYTAMIKNMDESLGRVMAILQELKLWENTGILKPQQGGV